MKKTIIFVFFLSLIMINGIDVINAGETKVIKWKMQCAYPPGDGSYDIFSKDFIKLMEKESHSNLKIELFTPGALTAVTEMVNAVSRGMYEVGFIYPMSYAGSVPIGDVVSGLPGAWSDDEKGIDEITELFWGDKYRLIDIVRAAYAKKGIYFFGIGVGGDYPFLVNFPLKQLDDLKGKKVRASGIGQKFLSSLGASSVFLPGGEIYMAIKLGTIDGTVFPTAILDKLKLQEVVKYAVKPGLTSPGVAYIINMKAWNKLPKDLRDSLTEKKRIDLFRDTVKKYIENNKLAEKKAKDAGVEFYNLPDSEISKARKIAMPLWDEVAKKDEFCAKAVEILKRYHKDKGNI